MSIRVQFVDRDGTYVTDGVRVRCAPGHGEGSLGEEYMWGVTTPLAGDDGREQVLSLISDPRLEAFVRSLPVARTVPGDEADG